MEMPKFNPSLERYVDSLESEFQNIAPGRLIVLNQLGEYILEKTVRKETVRLTFICTHNSRRSHFGQVWAATAARFYGLVNIETYSGGTESTAFNHGAVEALKRAGFEISISNEKAGNPEYALSGSDDFVISPIFSKKFDDPPNPAGDFAAIMVCSDADEACPVVPGASTRFTIIYDDPKAFDGTGLESAKYDERSRQIASEIFYVMNFVFNKLHLVI